MGKGVVPNMDMDICELGLGTRAENALNSRKIYRLKDLANLTEGRLSSIPSIGSDTVRAIKQRMRKYGVTLRKGN